MTNPTIALVEYLRKMGMDQDKDFLAESVRVMSQMLMELEAQKLTGAEKHERTPTRMNYRNGYRERLWRTRVGDYTGRRLSFKLGMSAIRSYEYELSQTLLDILAETPEMTIYGIKDTKRLEERVPTCAFTLKGKSPRQVAEELDAANIFVWDGNYYAQEVTTRLGLEDSRGMVRVGPTHYNTVEEIKKFRQVLMKIAEYG
jgi:hypothetical protein